MTMTIMSPKYCEHVAMQAFVIYISLLAYKVTINDVGVLSPFTNLWMSNFPVFKKKIS